MLKQLLSLVLFSALFTGKMLMANNGIIFDTKWISSKPEILNYRTMSEQGNGSYQTIITKGDSNIEVFTNMISPGFTATVSGLMTLDMVPLRSSGKTFIGNDVQMDNDTRYESGHLYSVTIVKPNNRIVKKDTAYAGRVVDPSQLPFLVRVLPFRIGAEFEFTIVHPHTSTLYPLSIKVAREESVQKLDCYKLLVKDFEGVTIYWVEKAGQHRAIRIEQPMKNRTTELIQ